jgi:CDP-glycerol glycerophosphotransferase
VARRVRRAPSQKEESPDASHRWLAAPAHKDAFPDDVQTVAADGPEAVAALEQADLLVANTHTDMEWVKRPGALYLQTWHGTPLKRIHHDVRWAPPGRLARLDRDIARWDVLLSPNAASSPRLSGAFRFTGEVVETGYPRNDALRSPGRDAVRRRVRAELGLDDATTAVLYTPTWRDDVVFGEGGPSPMVAQVPAILDRLGADECLLLRLHSFDVARHVPMTDPRVRDVSWHADVAELYLAADVLVTDYSSTMFDFAVTGKPLLYLVPDFERFRDEVRGFYFDLEDEAPGPLLRTGDELVAALHDLPGVHADYAEAYRAFAAKYTALEDGHATDRVVDLLTARLGDGS